MAGGLEAQDHAASVGPRGLVAASSDRPAGWAYPCVKGLGLADSEAVDPPWLDQDCGEGSATAGDAAGEICVPEGGVLVGELHAGVCLHVLVDCDQRVAANFLLREKVGGGVLHLVFSVGGPHVGPQEEIYRPLHPHHHLPCYQADPSGAQNLSSVPAVVA